ncbi:MAG: hypothetical protein OEY48_02930 [Gammaproteobacteria bacterium]|nr:hypothetical protein [Gammaproteobacteria bacterium]MDH5591782.1 hypothetical protein [Gammaproteobacteria bacterium]
MKIFVSSILMTILISMPVLADTHMRGEDMGSEQMTKLNLHMHEMEALTERIHQEKNSGQHKHMMGRHMEMMQEGMHMMNGDMGSMGGKENKESSSMRMDDCMGMRGQRMNMMQMMMGQMMEHMKMMQNNE